jgi:hypothetical protein
MLYWKSGGMSNICKNVRLDRYAMISELLMQKNRFLRGRQRVLKHRNCKKAISHVSASNSSSLLTATWFLIDAV